MNPTTGIGYQGGCFSKGSSADSHYTGGTLNIGDEIKCFHPSTGAEQMGTVGLIVKQNNTNMALLTTAKHNGIPTPYLEELNGSVIAESDLSVYYESEPIDHSIVGTNDITTYEFLSEDGIPRKPCSSATISSIWPHDDIETLLHLSNKRYTSDDDTFFVPGALNKLWVNRSDTVIIVLPRSFFADETGLRLEGKGSLLGLTNLKTSKGDSGACLLLEQNKTLSGLGVLLGHSRWEGLDYAFFTMFTDLVAFENYSV